MSIFKADTIVIEIGKRFVKLIQVTTAGAEAKVTTCALREYLPSDSSAAGEALKKIFSEHNIKQKDVILSVSRQFVTAKNIKLPSQDAREINEMAGFQAVKQIPYPKEEIIYGSYVTGVDTEGYSKVMLTICHRDVVNGQIAILQECGLRPSAIVLSSFGLLNWFNLSGRLGQDAVDASLVLVDCDIDTCDIAIISKRKLIYTRGLGFGTGEEGYVRKLAEEINKTLSVYEKESDLGLPAKAFFTGDVTGAEESKSILETSLNMKVECIGYGEQASFSSLLGSALGLEGVDLLPKELKAARETQERKNNLIVSVSLALAVVAALSLAAGNRIHQKTAVLNVIESKLKQITPEAQKIEKMRLASDVIKSQLKKKSEALDVLSELNRIIPPQIYLSMYNYDDDKAELKGSTKVLSDVFRLVTILEDSPYFQNVQVRYATKRKIGEEEFVDFEIACPLSTGVSSTEEK